MKKYEVILDLTVSKTVTVEANDEDEAKQLAEEIIKESPYSTAEVWANELEHIN